MSAPATDGSEDVNDFLERIKELGDRRDQEDEERNRKLEEEILQGRRERQARRAERARSISPTKSSPASTPTASRISAVQSAALSRSNSPKIEPAGDPEPQREMTDDAMENLTGTATSSTKENTAPIDGSEPISKRPISIKTSPLEAMPSRGSPLSWQRRPNSQASDRPRSMATENATRSPKATPETSPVPVEPTLSREQIAQSLASKDPAWFRQTADRGLNSAAYRRNQVEDEDRSDHGSFSSSSRILMPGMLQKGSGSDITIDDTAERTTSPPTSSVSYGSSRASVQLTSKPAGEMGSPMPLTAAQRLDPPMEPKPESSGHRMSPSQGRISPDRLERPPSPTKGMGGFVQSAMMKRSDSVNKRWSVQSSPGINRVNSVASSRTSADPFSSAARESAHNTLSHDNSPHPNSRPTSSHSNATITQERPGTSSSMKSSMAASTTDAMFVKPSLPSSRSQTPLGIRTSQDEASLQTSAQGDAALPVSPSKTMDTRRWSPTKSSWLESALNKPDSPKPKAVPPPQQPAWKSEINKAKQKGSIDLGRSTAMGHKHEVSIGGLMRSPPPGGLTKPTSLGGLPAGLPAGAVSKHGPVASVPQDRKEAPKTKDSTNVSISQTVISKSASANDKVKPETPPKKDFRANLKSRQPPPESGSSNEPEFKNVFGQLRRTKIQNYVAPDELKDNISRGKAALNITGGPKKTERKDEFKDAILKKKEDFKKVQLDGKGITRTASGGSQDAPLPEALAKRRALGRSDSIVSETGSNSGQRVVPESPKPSFVKETRAPGTHQAKDAPASKLAGRLNPGLAGLLARGPPSMGSDNSRPSSPAQSQRTSSISTTTAETPGSGSQLTHMTKGRARGPRRKAPTSSLVAPITNDALVQDQMVPAQSPPSSANTASTQQVDGSQSENDVEAPASQPSSPRKLDMKRRSQFLREVPQKNNNAEPQLESPKPISPTKKANSTEVPLNPFNTSLEPSKVIMSKPSPIAPAKSLPLTSRASEKLPPATPVATSIAANAQHSLALVPNATSTRVPTGSASPSSTKPPIPRSGQTSPIRDQQPTGSVKSSAAVWNRPASIEQQAESPKRVKSPIKLPTHEDEKAAMIGAGLRSPSPTKRKAPAALGLQLTSEKDTTLSRSHPKASVKGQLSPPLSAGLMPSGVSTAPEDSPVPQASEASKFLSDFFGANRSMTDFDVDTTSLLSARPDLTTDIKTLNSALYQLLGDGKKQLVPNHQERILFEGNMYICNHTFMNTSGRKSIEVYLWLGDEVSKSAIDEIEAFSRREARTAGGKLIKIQQGKETPAFFHALGGIIIIRRGSSHKYDSLAPHILCGRNYFGQIAFDEVDFSPASLCSGFPYLVSTQSGKSYLWKGKGSGIDELSCARLIGMEFGLTGEVVEVEDGNEPASFLQIFGNGSKIPKSADHWRMKPNYNKYCGRLFLADSKAKEQIVELIPFTQGDLDASKVYILDAFFEIYIIVGSQAQSEYSAFHNALMFAQEYGILAAGIEDRPFVPVTTVVLEGVPRDMKSVFRKWVAGLSPTYHLPPSGGLQRWKSLRVVPLTAALEATRN